MSLDTPRESPATGATPDLSGADRLGADELLEAALEDLRQRWQRGERDGVAAYLERYPALRDVEATAALVYQEFVLRGEAVEDVSFDECLRQFPQCAAALRRLHLADVVLEQALFPPRPPAPPSGRRVGDYELLDEIARGGMGVVYRARQVSLGRVVALKMILGGGLASDADGLRLRNEAEAAARLQHPGIVAIHEVGERDGQPYFSMDYVEGPTLAALVREQPLPAARAARYVEGIARAVQHAHEQGVLHRDLKPSNVLVDADDRPHVTDFGLARQVHVDRRLTGTGEVLGTPSYMPPEQASDRKGAIGPASDVYALGAILYELLTGRPPFQAETAFDTLLLVLGNEPVPPRRLNPRVPRDLETVCLKCLEKEPRKRYPTAAALADDLARFQRGEPVQARPIRAAARAWRWCRRKPVLATLLGLAGVFVGVLAGGTLLLAAANRAARLERDRAVEQTKKARQRFAQARDAVDRLQTAVSQSRALKALGAERVRRKLLEDAAEFYERFAEEEEADAEVRLEQGRICGRLGDVYRELGREDDAEKAYERAKTIFASLVEARPDSAHALQGLAAAHFQMGRLCVGSNRRDDAKNAFQESLRLNARLLEEHPEYASHPRYQLTHAALLEQQALLYQDARQWDDAEKAHREALRLRRELVATRPGDTEYELHLASGLDLLADLLRDANRLDDAEKLLAEGLLIRKRLAEAQPDDPELQRDLAASYESLGHLGAARLNPRKAADSYEPALAILKRLAAEHPDVLAYKIDVGGCLCNLGNMAAASGQYEPAVTHLYNPAIAALDPAVQKAARAPHAKEYLGNALGGRATCYRRLGRYAEAVDDLDRAVRLADGETRARFLVTRAIARAQAGDHRRAVTEAEELADSAPLLRFAPVDVAAVYSHAIAATGKDAKLSQPERETAANEYAARALEHLKKARAAGFFADPGAVKYYRDSVYWEALRPYPAFQQLLTDLTGR
jgi:serine/threonine-protein kinase